MDLEDPRYAYMYGFLQADGHLHRGVGKKGRLSVEISHRDIHILREFQRLTPYYSTIRERTRRTNFADAHTSAVWTLCSLEARDRLAELGLPYGRKSRKVKPPRVPFSRPDYLRGVIDADGSVGCTGAGLPFLSLTTASAAIAAYVCFYAKRVTGAERRPRRNSRDGVFNILYTKESAISLVGHFYYPGSLALDRKRKSAEEASRWVRPESMRQRMPSRRWRASEDRLLLDTPDPRVAAQLLGRTLSSCQTRLWRFRTGEIPMPE